MIFNSIKILGLIIITSFSSCSPTKLSPADYIVWVKNVDNGLYSSVLKQKFDYTLFFRPLDYLKLQNKDFSVSTEEQLSSQYFVLTIKSKNGKDALACGVSDENEYQNRQFYLSDYLGEDIKLIQGKDTLSCTFFHYERNYGLAPYVKVSLEFDNPTPLINEDRIVIFKDPIFSFEEIHFHFSASSINSIPKLDTE